MSQSTTASAKGDLKLRIGLRKGCQNMKYYILIDENLQKKISVPCMIYLNLVI